jgi:hypothetical protein
MPTGAAPGEPHCACESRGGRETAHLHRDQAHQSVSLCPTSPGKRYGLSWLAASTLTPAHHLRGAAKNTELSAKLGQVSALSKRVAAPRLVHALVSLPQIVIRRAGDQGASEGSSPSSWPYPWRSWSSTAPRVRPGGTAIAATDTDRMCGLAWPAASMWETVNQGEGAANRHRLRAGEQPAKD